MRIPPEPGDPLAAAAAELRTRLVGFFRARVPTHETAEDLAQDVLARLAAQSARERAPDNLAAWAFRAARRVLVDFYRRRASGERLRDNMRREEDAAARKPFAPNESELAQLRAGLRGYVRGVIAALPEPYREALDLVEFKDMGQAELAKRLGLSLSAAKSRVQRGRALARKAMEQCCDWEFDKYGAVVEVTPKQCECA